MQNLKHLTTDFCNELAGIESEFQSGLPAQIALNRLNESIKDSCISIGKLKLAENGNLKQLQTEFRESIQPWFSQSWFMNRALTKPRGYPGDFEILESIYNVAPKTANGIGKLLDEYFLQTDLAKAVRGRKEYCKTLIDKTITHATHTIRILDIACGPCRELREINDGFKQSPFQFVGLDYDQHALDYTQGKLLDAAISGEKFQLLKHNVLMLINPKRNVETLGMFDLIYSVGLYDYLPYDILASIINGTLPMLNKNGKYVIAFKDCNRYDKTEYQWHVDWHFYQRTEEDCIQLLDKVNADIIKIERDESGIILFFHLMNP
jgi:SAM-dependent methyltransferase